MTLLSCAEATPERMSEAVAAWLFVGELSLTWGVTLKGQQAGAERVLRIGTREFSAQEPLGRDALLARLRALPEQAFSGLKPGTPLHVLLSDAWVGMEMLPWSEAVVLDGSGVRHGGLHLAAQGHRVLPDDVVRLDDQPMGAARLAVLFPAELIGWLRQFETVWQLKVQSLQALSLAAWQALGDGSPERAIAVVDELSVAILGVPARASSNGAGLGWEIHHLPLPAVAGNKPGQLGDPLDGVTLNHAWRRLCMRAPHWSQVPDLRWLNCSAAGVAVESLGPPFLNEDDGQGTKAAKPLGTLEDVIAFVTDARSQHALDGWAAGGRTKWRQPLMWASAMLLAVSGALAMQNVNWYVQTQEAETEVATLAQQRPGAVREPALTKQELSRVGAINAAVQQLNMPVHALLAALQPPRDLRVAVLSVDSVGSRDGGGYGAQSSGLRIVAQAPESTDMMRYVAYVGERRPFLGAHLLKHEWVDGGSQRVLRFTLEAVWSEQ